MSHSYHTVIIMKHLSTSIKTLFVLLGFAAAWFPAAAKTHYVGGDISLLPEYEEAGAVYKDHEGKPIAEVLPWFRSQGMNAMRVRLFVNPDRYKELHQNDTNADTRYDPNACQDMEYILPLCKRIVDAGFDLMLDFHYSDTWADPAKQWTPVDWQDLTQSRQLEIIYEYTYSSLTTLKEAGVVPAFIQTGNEISYGMMWGEAGTKNPLKVYTSSSANWVRFVKLFNNAAKACREVCPEAKIICHTERVANPGYLKDFYAKMDSMGADYDIIGLSYYPYFHGDLTTLDTALSTLEENFPGRDIMIVETGYSYKWAVPGTNHDYQSQWAYSDAGQDKFARELVATLEAHPACTGLFWWWMEYNAFGTSLSGWYNAALFDSTTGRATSALKTICTFADADSGITAPDAEAYDEIWYDLSGRRTSPSENRGLKIGRKGKFIRK
ncbi:MAG: arabinogalactan endo-1,4-beta-galactosidase [Muribaculaceae bacterium]|nr:arabinogalactan endo-1,4-beta-galactosidase [Muribaculaceae bacterium]